MSRYKSLNLTKNPAQWIFLGVKANLIPSHSKLFWESDKVWEEKLENISLGPWESRDVSGL